MAKTSFSWIKRAGFILEAVCVIPLGNLAALMPWRIGNMLAAFMGRFLFCISRTAKGRAFHNLGIVFAHNRLSVREKQAIIRRLFIHVATSVFEYVKLGAITAQNHEAFTGRLNREVFEEALSEKRGVLAISAHIGNWEMLASVAAKKSYNIGAIIHRQLNPYTDKWLRRIREKKGGVKCFYDETRDLRQIIGHLKKNGILAILADEIYPVKPLYIPFFERQAATPDGPAKLHLLYGSPLVLCFLLKQADGTYLSTFEGPYHFPKSGDMKKDCEKIMAFINRKYETVIRKHPDQWFSLLTPRWEQNQPEHFRNRSWK